VLVEEGAADRPRAVPEPRHRSRRRPGVIASAAGGMDIEEGGGPEPEKILKRAVGRGTGVMPFQGRKLAFAMGLEAGPAGRFVKLLEAVYEAFIETDASMIEINPLVVTKGGDLLALDAKVTSTTTRSTAIPTSRPARPGRGGPARGRGVEVLAQLHPPRRHIGCMVNGAGLAMATMDIIKLAGASRPTSSTSAAAPTPSRSATPSRS
jgi:succinyl-CoA synthetase beta subunit